MNEFISEFRKDIRSRLPWLVAIVLVAALTATGPFGTYVRISFWGRLLFWVPVILLGVLVGTAIGAFVHGTLGARDLRRGTVLAVVFSTLLLAPPLFLLIIRFLTPTMNNLAGFSEVALLVASATLGVCAIRMAEAMENTPPLSSPLAAQDPSLTRQDARLVDRLSPDLRGPILAISGRDHYVDVLTDKGTARLLLRFSDAVQEADPEAGTQIHRSHWVAWSAIQTLRRDGARYFVSLEGGQDLPASKSHIDKLVQRGFELS